MYSLILLFLNLGGGEIFFILLIVLLLFGGKGVPTIAKTLGKSIREFKDAASGIQRDFTSSAQDIKSDIEKETQVIEEEVQEIKRNSQSIESSGEK